MKKYYIFFIGLLLIISGILIFIFNNSNKVKYVEFNSVKDLNILNNNIEVYSDIKLSDIISYQYSYDDVLINTKTVGENKIEFNFYDKGKKKYKTSLIYYVIDSMPPILDVKSNYYSIIGDEVDLKKNMFFVDNYDSNIDVEIVGYYDINEKGIYELKARAIDSSNNITERDFKLNIVEKLENNSSSSISSKFDFSDFYDTYKKDDNILGIDVSKWQGDIDYNKVKDSGVEFVMIRVGAQNGVGGEYVIDPYFEKNIENAYDAGLKIGVYFYSYTNSVNESTKQAQFVLSQVSDYSSYISLPIVFDFECWNSFKDMNLSLYQLNEVANAFFTPIKNEGFDVMLYGSKNYLEKIWIYNTLDVWLAHYNKSTDYQGNYSMWQIANNGRVDGINESVDFDILYLN